MLLERTGLLDRRSEDAQDQPTDEAESKLRRSTTAEQEKPLTCMVFFFASQMSRHLRSALGNGQSSSNSPDPQHSLDALLDRVKIHAAFSPHVTQFETYPVEIPRGPARPKWKAKESSRESLHDTMALMKFRNKRAWEQWIATPEWSEFMQKTDHEGVFRRMPHVRCANSLKGLRDPIEVLMA